ncbi:MAG: SixA phosphatase family protein [Bacteroidota bacterium]
MKTLIIVRHGKSSWGYENVSDIDRPLKNRGIRNGYEMANRLVSRGIIPDKIVASPATRALHSAMIFLRVLKVSLQDISINEILYHGIEKDIINMVKSTDNTVNSLMIFGHNPTFTSLANLFTQGEIDNIPTTGVVILKFGSDSWESISEKTLVEEIFDYPKKES